ncbi:MAG: PAS domain-containing protein, partial [Calditrichia bacterium]
MIETIYSKWQKQVLKSPYSDSIPLYQKKNVFLKFLEAIYQNNNDIYYLLPEIIDFVESNGLDPHNFLDTLFILRDEIVAQSPQITDRDFDVYKTLELLQDITIKIGAYFTHLRMDLNITRNKVQALDSDRIEANILQLNEDFIIEKTNSSLLTYFGYEKQEVIGKTLTTLFSSSSQTILNNALGQLKNNQRFKI